MTSTDSTKTGVKRKRSVNALLTDIPPLKSIKFKSMESPHRSATANLPNIDPRNPYALFSLYISESDIQNIACSTNAYAEIQILKNSAINPQNWQSTTSAEIKDLELVPGVIDFAFLIHQRTR
ncbi:predicted protein [Histoplasma mississippiense (nom. inval.)]|uniref:predicted protein n=1 Tax=Ajellomyces capsulatus (strain NAm1 / WU24) TaxID=2059318 RepID=UPI000157C6BC|nr:predicted protein [Histoplasma mississippiense (nom. inval.)]EDN08377.1 predicted protein [Histoplasma mississippiense (nom. inval.)]